MLQFIIDHGAEILAAAVAVLSAVIAVSLLIPGEQPEKALQAVLDFLKKISKK